MSPIKHLAQLNILYRGTLSSCNYSCGYCPFAKHWESPSELAADRAGLERFVDWCQQQQRPLGILFTPWGEALVRLWYRQAVLQLASLPHVQKVAVQTNLSRTPDWLSHTPDDQRQKIALWCTWHPDQCSMPRFLERCQQLRQLGVNFSVGVVGRREVFRQIEQLRQMLPDDVYLWINAMDDDPSYYQASEIARLTQIDPNFPTNARHHISLGKHCFAGERAISVDSHGSIQRCHFVEQKLGNLYENDLDNLLQPRPCPNQSCNCHIGYIHMPHLQQYPVYGHGLLERIPAHYRCSSM